MPTLNEFPYPARDIFYGIVELAERRVAYGASLGRAHTYANLDGEESDEVEVAEAEGESSSAALRGLLNNLGDKKMGAWQVALDNPPGCFDGGGEPDDSPASAALRDMQTSGTWLKFGVACIAFTMAPDLRAAIHYLEQIIAGKPLTLPAQDGEAVK